MDGILLIGRDFSEAEGIWGLSPCLSVALATLPQHRRMWHLEEQERSPRPGQGMPKQALTSPGLRGIRLGSAQRETR